MADVAPAPGRPRPLETWLIVTVFILALGFNGWAAAVGWWHANLPGHEFRQTQTAISAYFIQQERNFSLAYPTPILGKPWSIPFEFPLYQWTVVAVSDATGLPVTQAGRLVSTACFLLLLPALYLLLRRLALAPAHCLVALSFVVLCPLYLFYERAVLIETMALMFGCWYAALLPLVLERRCLGWVLLVNAAGAGAGLVKVTTFMIFLPPAFIWCVYQLWLARPRGGDWRPLLRTVGWLAAAHAGGFAATVWWVHCADAIKSLNFSARDLQSASMTAWNFGTGRRLDPELWGRIRTIVLQEITPPAVLAAAAVAALAFGRRHWAALGGLLALWGGVFLTFPLLYALHDYYHVAAAFLPMLAVGLAAAALFQRAGLPRVGRFAVWLLLLSCQAITFLDFHYPQYRDAGSGGGLAEALKMVLRRDEVIVVAGDDWSSIFPYFAGHRALMIRSGKENEPAFLHRAFADLRGEDVGALVLFEDQAENESLLRLARESFDLGPVPLLRWRHGGRRAVAYFPRSIQPDVLVELGRTNGFANLQVNPAALPVASPLEHRSLAYASLLRRHQHLFSFMHPRPARFYADFRPELWNIEEPGRERISASPSTKLWFTLPPGRHRLRTNLDIVAGAWEGVKPADASDGVGVVARAWFSEDRHEVLRERHVNPAANPGDRGVQVIDWELDLPPGAELQFEVNAGPANNGARDWVSLGPLTID